MTKKTLFSIAFGLSLFANGVLLILCVAIGFYRMLDGCAEIADGRLGRLRQDLEVRSAQGGKVLLRLPKGLIVRDASATGMGWFEPHRFRLVVTSDRADLVDYKAKIDEETASEYYSADTK